MDIFDKKLVMGNSQLQSSIPLPDYQTNNPIISDFLERSRAFDADISSFPLSENRLQYLLYYFHDKIEGLEDQIEKHITGSRVWN